MKNPWQTLASRVVYKNPWMKIRENKVIRPDGKQGIYGYLDWPGSIIIVPMTSRQEIYLIGQWRYTAGKFSWEIPAGSYQRSRESALRAAKRELAEEAGIQAKRWKLLGVVHAGLGVTTDRGAVYLAKGISKTNQKTDGSEYGMRVKRMPLDAVVREIQRGSIFDSYTISGIFKLLLYLKKI